MQIQLFTIPIWDDGSEQRELNKFLGSHKVLEVTQHFVGSESGAYWTFCVTYLHHGHTAGAAQAPHKKIDYRQELDAATFARFAELRAIRKKVAADEGVSAYIIFTDEELSALAKLEEITAQSMLGIKGIGEKKIARFAQYFITKPSSDETSGEIN